jgi:hypothetical protein
VFGRVEPGAAFYAVVRPEAAAALIDWLSTKTGILGDFFASSFRDDAELGQAGDLFTRVIIGGATSGLSPGVPVVLTVTAPPVAQAEKAFTAAVEGDAKAKARAPRLFTRARAVAAVSDEAKLRAAVLGWAASAPEGFLVVPTAGDASAGAFLSGDAKLEQGLADAKLGKAALAAFAKRKIIVVALPRDGSSISFFRIDGGWFYADTFEGLFAPVEWKTDGAALLKILAQKPGKGAAAELASAAGKQLVDAELGVLVEPGRILDLGRVLGYSTVAWAAATIKEPAEVAKIVTAGSDEVVSCEGFRSLAKEGPLAQMSFTARRKGTTVEVTAFWALRTPGVLDAAMATSDDGLVDLAAASGIKLLALVPLAGTEAWRKLPRPGVLGKGLAEATESARKCGAAGSAVSVLFGWPQLAAMALESDELLGGLFKSARNAVLAIKDFGSRPRDMQMVMLTSVAGPGSLDGWFEERLGKGKAQTVGARKLTVWRTPKPDGPIGVGTTGVDGRSGVYGAVFGGDAVLSWWWGQASPKSTAGPTGFVALIRTDLPWLLGVLASTAGMNARDLRPAFANLGALKGTVNLTSDTLTATATIEVK